MLVCTQSCGQHVPNSYGDILAYLQATLDPGHQQSTSELADILTSYTDPFNERLWMHAVPEAWREAGFTQEAPGPGAPITSESTRGSTITATTGTTTKAVTTEAVTNGSTIGTETTTRMTSETTAWTMEITTTSTQAHNATTEQQPTKHDTTTIRTANPDVTTWMTSEQPTTPGPPVLSAACVNATYELRKALPQPWAMQSKFQQIDNRSLLLSCKGSHFHENNNNCPGNQHIVQAPAAWLTRDTVLP